MHLTFVTYLSLLSCLLAAVNASSETVISVPMDEELPKTEPAPEPTPQIPESQKIRKMELVCERALGPKWTEASLKNLFNFVPMNPHNWEDFIYKTNCAPLFAQRCGVLNEDHMKQIMKDERWTSESGDIDFGGPKERFAKMSESGCVRRIRVWSAITEAQLDYVGEYARLPNLLHWYTFKSPILKALMIKQGAYVDFPAPSQMAIDLLIKHLKYEDFLDGASNFWFWIDSTITGLASETNSVALGETLHSAFLKIKDSLPLHNPVPVVLWLLRTESFIQALVLEPKNHGGDLIKKVIKELAAARQNLLDQVTGPSREFVIRCGRNVSSITEQELKNAAGDRKCSFRSAAKEFMKTLASGAAKQPVTLQDMAAFLNENRINEEIRDSWLADFAMLQEIGAQNGDLAVRIITKALPRLQEVMTESDSLDSYSFNPPLMPFRILTSLLQAENDEVISVVKPLLLNAIGNDEKKRTKLINFLSAIPALKPASFALINDVPHLYNVALRTDFPSFSRQPALRIRDHTKGIEYTKNDEDSDNDRGRDKFVHVSTELDHIATIIAVIDRRFDRLISPKLMVKHTEFVDAGGPRREVIAGATAALRTQDVVTPLKNTDMLTKKFMLFIGREFGKLIGFLFGKSLQLRFSLPYTIDPEFFALAMRAYPLFRKQADLKRAIGGQADSPAQAEYDAIQEKLLKMFLTYYRHAYAAEYEEYAKNYLLINEKDPEDQKFREFGEYVLTPAISQLPTAKPRIPTKLNPSIATHADIKSDKLPAHFAETEYRTVEMRKKYLEDQINYYCLEFMEFTRNFIDALGSLIHLQLLRYSFLPNVLDYWLNPREVPIGKLIDALKIENGDAEVDSLIVGKKIAAKDAFISVMRCLNHRQIGKFIGLISGSPTYDLTPKSLIVSFQQNPTSRKHWIPFCRTDGPPPQPVADPKGKAIAVDDGEQISEEQIAGGMRMSETRPGEYVIPISEDEDDFSRPGPSNRHQHTDESSSSEDDGEEGEEEPEEDYEISYDEESSAQLQLATASGRHSQPHSPTEPRSPVVEFVDDSVILAEDYKPLLKAIAQEQARILEIEIAPDYDPYDPDRTDGWGYLPFYASCGFNVQIPLTNFIHGFLASFNLPLNMMNDKERD